MSAEQNHAIAQQFLTRLGQGDSPESIAELFSHGLDFEIPGDIGSLPWVGYRKGRIAAADFVRNVRSLTERLRFDVDDIFANEQRAIILGTLATRIKSTGRLIETSFAIILTVGSGLIARFQMLEDSFAVSLAARPTARRR
ncbi:nuclear transport factor 2 family protein [Granulicella sp. L46]|uniref:nuclear transport factor 2 family protein n=1 Tax=Granulicella sp. L46 TaxID=1641865 RepID=UPI00131EB162|nr:nuclear transport factor 2 family protein [Granulicella sp. L46]